LTNSISGLANAKHDKMNKAHKNAKKTQAVADDLKSQIMKMLYTFEEVDPKIKDEDEAMGYFHKMFS
jgi:hypothetical protein